MGRRWPAWWTGELEFSSHLVRRMADRRFTEVDLRSMLEGARAWRPDVEKGRRVIRSSFRGGPWEVVVEPDRDSMLLVVITAYPVE